MIIYGKNSCKVVLESNIEISKIYLQEGFSEKEIISLIENKNLKINYLPKNKMNDLADGVHQGIILSIPNYKYMDLDEVLGENKFVVMLDHLEDPHNFGAIVRTCEASGVDAIIIPSDREIEVNPTVVKTSVGTVFQTKIIKVVNLVDTINYLKENGYWIVGTSLEGNLDYREVDYSGNGMSKLVTKNCDYLTKIPMYGETNSLNASVAAGIMIYEVIRNRK